MSINNNKLLPELTKSFGNIYECVNHVANEARHLANCPDFSLTESTAMTWILSGEPPEDKQIEPQEFHVRGAKIAAIDELLWTVNDPEIIAAVTRSVFKSWRAHHLLYDYIDVTDSPRQSRVRILTRMIWYTYLTTPRRILL